MLAHYAADLTVSESNQNFPLTKRDLDTTISRLSGSVRLVLFFFGILLRHVFPQIQIADVYNIVIF